MPTVSIEHIEIDANGNAKIIGSRSKVKQIVLDHAAGLSPEQIVEAYPHLTLAQVHAALAYYFDHRDAIDTQIEQERTEYEAALANDRANDPIRQRLRSAGRIS